MISVPPKAAWGGGLSHYRLVVYSRDDIVFSNCSGRSQTIDERDAPAKLRRVSSSASAAAGNSTAPPVCPTPSQRTHPSTARATPTGDPIATLERHRARESLFVRK